MSTSCLFEEGSIPARFFTGSLTFTQQKAEKKNEKKKVVKVKEIHDIIGKAGREQQFLLTNGRGL